jgi:ABC-2 type transport system permease protein
MRSSRLLLTQTLAVAQRLLLEQWRQKRGLIFWSVFPATMMLLFGLVYAHNANMRAGLDAAAAGILVGAALFFSCLGGTVSVIAADRQAGADLVLGKVSAARYACWRLSIS